jgi:hypothetical protein
MSAIFRRILSRLATGKLSPEPEGHRPNRHKKFHVRPEALGKGYENYGIIGRPGSLPVVASPANTSLLRAEGVRANAPGPAIAAASEWNRVSRETELRAARNALGGWLWIVVLLGAFVLLLGYRGWVWRLIDWMHQFPLPTH